MCKFCTEDSCDFLTEIGAFVCATCRDMFINWWAKEKEEVAIRFRQLLMSEAMIE